MVSSSNPTSASSIGDFTLNTGASPVTFTEDSLDGRVGYAGGTIPNESIILLDGTSPKGFTYQGEYYLSGDSPNFPVDLLGDGQYRTKCPIEGVSQGCLVSVDFEMLGEE